MSKYIKVLNLSFQNLLEYKTNFILSFLFKLIPFAVNMLIWLSILNQGSDFDMSRAEIITYYCLTLITTNFVTCTRHENVASDIRDGNINRYLIQPISYLRFQLFSDLPYRLIFLLLGMPFVFVIFLIFGSDIQIAFNAISYVFFICALLVGYLINFLLMIIMSELSFYFTNVASFFSSFEVLKNIAAGSIFPLSLLPSFMKNLLTVLPFSYITFLPINILLNKMELYEIVSSMCMGIVWIVVLFIICKVLWSNGLKKYAAFGG